MGRRAAIANPYCSKGRRSRFWASEQGVGRRSMSAGFVAMAAHARDFGFEQGNAGVQLVLRIRIKILVAEALGCVFGGVS